MTPDEVRQLCRDILAKGPDIAGTQFWTARLAGVEVTFSSGAKLWLAITTASAGAVPAPAAAPPASSSPLPQLYNRDGKIELLAAERYLAAVFDTGQAPGIIRAYPYSAGPLTPSCPGVGLLLDGGARAYLPIAHTAPARQRPAGRPFEQLYVPL